MTFGYFLFMMTSNTMKIYVHAFVCRFIFLQLEISIQASILSLTFGETASAIPFHILTIPGYVGPTLHADARPLRGVLCFLLAPFICLYV